MSGSSGSIGLVLQHWVRGHLMSTIGAMTTSRTVWPTEAGYCTGHARRRMQSAVPAQGAESAATAANGCRGGLTRMARSRLHRRAEARCCSSPDTARFDARSFL